MQNGGSEWSPRSFQIVGLLPGPPLPPTPSPKTGEGEPIND